MKKTISLGMTICMLLLCSIAGPAQETAASQTKPIEIPDGTELSAVTTELITSKTATEGDPVVFRVDEDLKINNMVVIAKGTMVKGYVSNAEKNGHFGKAGKLGLRIESTQTVDKQTIKLRASKGKEGEGKTGTTVALVVLFGPLGFLKHGKNAEIKEGTKIKVFTDETKTVQIAM